MSTVLFNGLVVSGAGYLVRAHANLVGATLQLVDLDVHVLVRSPNGGDAELTRANELADAGPLAINAYDDGYATHRFDGIRLAGRVSARTPQARVALLSFRFPTQTGPDGADHPGWVDFNTGLPRVRCLYPRAHLEPADGGGSLYPDVTLPDRARVHTLLLAGEDYPREAGHDEVVGTDPRQLLGFVLADAPRDGAVLATRLGFDSYRTNSCRWLEFLTRQDAHWRAQKATAGAVAGRPIDPVTVTVTNPSGRGSVTLELTGTPGGKLLYTEAGGDLAAAAGAFSLGSDADRWAAAVLDPSFVVKNSG